MVTGIRGQVAMQLDLVLIAGWRVRLLSPAASGWRTLI
jgi:hypothetical protein